MIGLPASLARSEHPRTPEAPTLCLARQARQYAKQGEAPKRRNPKAPSLRLTLREPEMAEPQKGLDSAKFLTFSS